ncbi:MAG TPA: glycosyl hydrolase 115 family protein, partial [Phycisphaeraceae bacterium]
MARIVCVLILVVSHAAVALAADAPGFVAEAAGEGDFVLADGEALADVYVDAGDHAVARIAAGLLADDVERVTGRKPAVKHDPAALRSAAVLIGTLGHSPIIDQLAAKGRIDVEQVHGQWETFIIQTVEGPFEEANLAGVEQALVIAGSDRRGTAFGVFELSEQIGVSPWYWWADVAPTPRRTLIIQRGAYRVGPPSVKYRGIFINDEDWGLQPWAAKTFDPQFGDIGPKTYAKVFELLLRLKGNYLWPAMHHCTVEFGAVDRNITLADEWAIVMGAAHCEPLNRNNVWWKKDGQGEWRYDTNRANMMRYWEEWAQKRGPYEAVWTVGLRGIHDSGMAGPQDLHAQVGLLEQAIADQRQLLRQHVNPRVEQIPQVFTPYKEALTHYQAGLKLPDDVTILWCEDNYGYIRQLSTPQEQARRGRSGIYYHISYLGWPRPYLWLNTTPPALIWEEMTKAYAYGADRVWVLNVGDIKPGEIGIEFWQRLAWDIDRYGPDAQRVFLREWAAREFGEELAGEIASIMDRYYQLGFQRKPELMEDDLFSVVHHREAEQRLEAYRSIVARAESVDQQLPPS